MLPFGSIFILDTPTMTVSAGSASGSLFVVLTVVTGSGTTRSLVCRMQEVMEKKKDRISRLAAIGLMRIIVG